MRDETSDRRFPRAVFGHGTEPDARFTFANERTYLAWTRTALALLAAGVALEMLGPELHPGLRLAASLLLLVAGTLTPIASWSDWMRSERALRDARFLPHSLLGLGLGVVIVIVGILVLLAVVLR